MVWSRECLLLRLVRRKESPLPPSAPPLGPAHFLLSMPLVSLRCLQLQAKHSFSVANPVRQSLPSFSPSIKTGISAPNYVHLCVHVYVQEFAPSDILGRWLTSRNLTWYKNKILSSAVFWLSHAKCTPSKKENSKATELLLFCVQNLFQSLALWYPFSIDFYIISQCLFIISKLEVGIKDTIKLHFFFLTNN